MFNGLNYFAIALSDYMRLIYILCGKIGNHQKQLHSSHTIKINVERRKIKCIYTGITGFLAPKSIHYYDHKYGNGKNPKQNTLNEWQTEEKKSSTITWFPFTIKNYIDKDLYLYIPRTSIELYRTIYWASSRFKIRVVFDQIDCSDLKRQVEIDLSFVRSEWIRKQEEDAARVQPLLQRNTDWMNNNHYGNG